MSSAAANASGFAGIIEKEADLAAASGLGVRIGTSRSIYVQFFLPAFESSSGCADDQDTD